MSDVDPQPQTSADEPITSEPLSRKARRRARWKSWSRRRRRLTVIGVTALVVVIALIGATIGYTTYRNDQIHHIAVRNLTTVPSTGVENILMVGSTSRCALKQQNAAFGLCSQGVNGVNSDVILLMNLNPAKRRIAILSIPRDTFIPNARPDETNRIDSALAYGPSQLVKAIEQDFGIPISHFVVLNFDSFQGVVNALGGIRMYFPYKVKDAYSSLNIRRTGCIYLNGFQALAVVRARHMQYEVNGKWYYDGSGDLGRITRDHEFLRVLAEALSKRSLGNPITDNSIFGAIAPQLEVDTGFSLRNMVDLVLTYHSVDANNAPQLTLPVLVDPSFTYEYDGADYGSIVFPSEPQDQAAVATFTKAPLPGRKTKPESVSIALEGGIGSPSATSTTAAQLTKLGFKVVSNTEVPSVGPISETDVLYSPGHLADGERVLDELHGAVALGEATSSSSSKADVTLVTGSNFSVVAPTKSRKSSTSTSTNKSSTAKSSAAKSKSSMNKSSTKTTSALSSSSVLAQLAAYVLTSSAAPDLEAPTPAWTSLPSYDPRACPVGQHTKKKKAAKH